MKRLTIVGAVIACALVAEAVQVRAQTSSVRLAWDHGEPPAVAGAFTDTLQIDAAAPVPTTATCVVRGTGSRCTSAPFTLVSGAHTLIVTASNGFGSASSAPLSGAPPSQPVNVTITVTVNVP